MANLDEDLRQIHRDQIDNLNMVLSKKKGDNKANILPRKSVPVTSTKLFEGKTQNIYLDKNTRISFDMLTRLSYENSIIAAVINTRANQISNCSRPSNNKYDLGYRLRLMNEEEEPTDEDQELMSDIEMWLQTCGSTEQRHNRDQLSFEDFLKTLARDRLAYDSVAIELIPDMKGDLHHFLPVDGSSVRYINENFDQKLLEAMMETGQFSEHFDKEDLKNGEYAYCQVYEHRIMQGFNHDQLMVKHANPVTKLGLNGYPIGELEQVVNQVTSFLFGETHTRLYFMQGFSSKGILHIKDDVPEDELEAFRQHFYGQMTGTQNAFRTPIMAGINDVQWINLNNENRDMEWANWLDFLIKIITAIYLIDPSEINFDIVRGGGNTINEGNRNSILLQASRDKGLLPLFRFFESVINEILRRKDPKIGTRYIFEFTGIRGNDAMVDIERYIKEVGYYKTLNEIRKENDLPEIDGGNIILNPVYVQAVNQERQFEQQQEMMKQQAAAEKAAPKETTKEAPKKEAKPKE